MDVLKWWIESKKLTVDVVIVHFLCTLFIEYKV